MQKKHTYLTTDELSDRIKYDVKTIRTRLNDSAFIEGVHYIRPFGGRKILYLWEVIERDMLNSGAQERVSIPMTGGAVCNG